MVVVVAAIFPPPHGRSSTTILSRQPLVLGQVLIDGAHRAGGSSLNPLLSRNILGTVLTGVGFSNRSPHKILDGFTIELFGFALSNALTWLATTRTKLLLSG